MRMEEVLDKAAKKGVVMEVNGSPERLDLKAEHVRLALAARSQAGGEHRRALGRELHDNLPFAVGTARKGWATGRRTCSTRAARRGSCGGIAAVLSRGLTRVRSSQASVRTASGAPPFLRSPARSGPAARRACARRCRAAPRASATADGR